MGDRYNYRSDEQRGRENRPYQPQSHQSDWDEPRRGSTSRMSANEDWNANEDEPYRDRDWRGDRSFRDRPDGRDLEGRDDNRWAGDGGQFRHTDESGNFNAGGRSFRREGDRDRAMGNGAAGYPGSSRGQAGMGSSRGQYASEGWSGHYYGNNRGPQQGQSGSNYSGGGNYRSGGSQTSGQSYGGDYYGGGMGGGSYERDYQSGGSYGGRQGSWTQAGYNAGAQGGSWGGRNYDSGESYGRGDRSQNERWSSDRWQDDGNNRSAGRNFGRGDWSNSSNVGGTGYGARGMGRGSYETRDWNAGAGAESDWSEQRGEGQRDTGNMWNVGGRHAGKGPKGYTRSDDRIKEELSDRLTSHGDIDASQLEVQVKNGEVTLTGTVDSRDAKRMAEDLADQIQGVRQVSNQLRVERQAEQEMPGAQSQYGRAVSTRPNGADRNADTAQTRGSDAGRSATAADSSDTRGSDTETGVREGSETASASGSTQSGADRSSKVTGKSDKSDKTDRSH